MESEQGCVSNSETGKEASREQLSTARISFYLDLFDISNLTAKDYVRSINAENKLDKKEVREMRIETRTALVDLYFIRDQGLDPKPFEELWGDKAEEYSALLDGIYPQLQQRNDEIIQRASSLSTFDRMKISLKARKKLKQLSENQKAQLLSVVGYAESEERGRILKKLGISGVLTGIYALPYTVGIAGAIALEKANPLIHLEDLSSRSTQITIALSYLMSYSAAFVNSQTNIRLLKDQNINTCPNIFATGLYFLLRKLVPEKELIADLGVRAGTFAPGLVQEPAVIASLFVPILGPQAVLARNIAGGVLNLGQAGINEIWLKRKGKNKT